MENVLEKLDKDDLEKMGKLISSSALSVLIISLIGLYFISLNNYLLFHCLSEGFSIVIACGIFMIAWNTRQFSTDGFLLVIGIAYLFVSGFDLLHTLSYKGMGVFPEYGANLPTQLWIASRYFESISLLIAPLFINRKVNIKYIFVCFIFIFLFIVASIFFWDIFPDCFIDDFGLTTFKIISEYIISSILFAAIIHIYRKRSFINSAVLKLLVASIIFTIVAELAFTFYVSVYGLSNLVGHCFKVISFFLIYTAIIRVSLKAPHQLLFKKIKESEYKFRTLFEQAGDYIIVLEHQPGGPPLIVDANKAAVDKHGYTRDEFIGMAISDLDVESSKDVIEERVKQLLAGKHALFEMTHTKKDGSYFFAEASVNPLDIPGKMPLFISVERDITNRKKAEKALENNQNFLNSIIDQSPFATWISDEKGTIIKCNSALTKLLNITAEQLIGKYNVFEDEIAIEQGLIPKIRTVFEEGKTVNFSVDWDAPALGYKDSNKVYIEGTMFPIHDDKGNLTNVVDHWIDVTKRKRAEEEKANLEERLRQAQKMEAIGTLAGGIAHDFNNILGAILGYAEMARDDTPSGSTVAKDLDKVLEASIRAKDLVKQILAFSRQGNAERIPLQPASIVGEAIKMLRPSLPATIEINQNIDPKTGLILADPTQIHQILMNLGTNAFHAMEETGGKLDILLKETNLSTEDLAHEPEVEPGTFIQLSVCDSGPGMSPETKEKIFNPYFTTKEKGKGTGMGLSIVHGIAKDFGGYVSLYSELGEGTAFHVYLPVIEDDVLPEMESVKQLEGGKERILFIDDEEILAQMGKDMLERLGYHVTVRNNSLEALKTFQNQSEQFDIVITDQTMPGMTGSDIARRMIQIRPDIPIILCTGYSTIISEEKAKSMGIKEFALKPLSKKDLAVLIRKVLENS